MPRIKSLQLDTHHRQIALSFVWISLFVVIGKCAGAAKEMAIAWRYGVSDLVDAFVFDLNIINWPFNIWNSVLTVVLIPLIAEAQQRPPQQLKTFASELLGLTLIIGLALYLLCYWGLPLLLSSYSLGISKSITQIAQQFSQTLAAIIPLGLLISLFSAWTMARGEHSNTLLEGLPALCILIALLLPPTWLTQPLVFGCLTGFTLQVLCLAFPLRHSEIVALPQIGLHSPLWQVFWSSIGFMLISQLLTSLTTLVDQFFTAQLNVGALSTLSYANRIMALILGIAATAISRATLPIFADLKQNINQARFTRLVKQWSNLCLLIGLIGLGIGNWLATDIVKLLLERGEFTQQNTLQVAAVLRCLLWQLPFYAASMVLIAAFAAQKQYFAISVSGIMNLIIKAISIAFCIKLFGLTGVAISSVAMYAISYIYLYGMFLRTTTPERASIS